MKVSLNIDGEGKEVTVERKGDGYTVTVDGRAYDVSSASISDGVLNFFIGRHSYRAFVSGNERGTYISLDGRDHLVRDEEAADTSEKRTHHHGDGTVEAPMPGNIVAVTIQEGDMVKAGDPVVILESMKMQNEITSPVSGEVEKVNCKVGDQVAFNDVLVEIAPASS